MSAFIRLDIKGHWKGTEHQSRFVAYEYEEDEQYLENGVSCYNLSDKIEALEQLYNYWINTASLTKDDYKNMQITIFEGEYVGQGSDYEDIATCTKTIKELDTVAEVFNSIYIAKEKLQGYYFNEQLDDYEEVTKEEYSELLNNIEL